MGMCSGSPCGMLRHHGRKSNLGTKDQRVGAINETEHREQSSGDNRQAQIMSQSDDGSVRESSRPPSTESDGVGGWLGCFLVGQRREGLEWFRCSVLIAACMESRGDRRDLKGWTSCRQHGAVI